MKLVAIAAQTLNGVIGLADGSLPVKSTADMSYFKRMTTGHPVILGRKTFEETPLLPNRSMIILSRQEGSLSRNTKGVHWVSSPIAALELAEVLAESEHDTEAAYVIGGGEIYRIFLPFVDEVLLTIFPSSVPHETGMAFFPPLPLNLIKAEEIPLLNDEGTLVHRFVKNRRKR